MGHKAQDGVHKIINLLGLTGGHSYGSEDGELTSYESDYETNIAHGKVHESPDTHTPKTRNDIDSIRDYDSRPLPAPIEGGGGGGGASIIFRVSHQ